MSGTYDWETRKEVVCPLCRLSINIEDAAGVKHVGPFMFHPGCWALSDKMRKDRAEAEHGTEK